jgi:hypothetical protein
MRFYPLESEPGVLAQVMLFLQEALKSKTLLFVGSFWVKATQPQGRAGFRCFSTV